MRKILALEQDEPQPQDNGDTDRVIEADDSEQSETTQEQELKLADLSELSVNQLEEMKESQHGDEVDETVVVMRTDVPHAADLVQKALENFKIAIRDQQHKNLKLACEQMQDAGGVLGIENPTTIPTEAAEVLLDSHLNPATEGLASTISAMIKAIIAALKKAAQSLQFFLKDCWRHLRALDTAINEESDRLVRFRKQYKTELIAAAEQQNIDALNYVSLPSIKRYLSVAGVVPNGDSVTFEAEFSKITALADQSARLENFVNQLPGALQRVLDLVSKNEDGLVQPEDIEAVAKVERLSDYVIGKRTSDKSPLVFSPFLVAHDVKAPDGYTLLASPELLGNLVQVLIVDTDNASQNMLKRLEMERLDFARDTSTKQDNGYMRRLNTAEVEACAKLFKDQAQALITMQHVGDRVNRTMDQLGDLLKKVDAQVYQNNQGNPQQAAYKNELMLQISRAVVSAQTSCNVYFKTVSDLIRKQQQAWLTYLIANHQLELQMYKAFIDKS